MEMHQIRYFLAVADSLNFTRAAEECHVAQPSLTRAIKKLEDELGGALFLREHHQTKLTELGHRMRPYMEAVLQATAAARADAQEHKRAGGYALKLGVMCTINPRQLIAFFDQLKGAIPSLDLELAEGTGPRLIEELQAGRLDLALIGMPGYPEDFEARPLFTERYTIAFPPGHRFEALNAIPIRELDGQDYLQRIHCEFRYHFAALGIPKPYQVRRRYHSEREDWIQAMIMAGLGVAIMPEYLPTIPGLPTRLIVDPEVARTISLVSVRGRPFSPAEQAAVRLAKRYRWNGSGALN